MDKENSATGGEEQKFVSPQIPNKAAASEEVKEYLKVQQGAINRRRAQVNGLPQNPASAAYKETAGTDGANINYDTTSASLSGTKVIDPPNKYKKSFRTFVPHSVLNLPIANPFLAAEAMKMAAGNEAQKAPADLTSSQIHERYQKVQSARSTGRGNQNKCSAAVAERNAEGGSNDSGAAATAPNHHESMVKNAADVKTVATVEEDDKN